MDSAIALPAVRPSPPAAVDIAALVGAEAWARLSPAVRRRFACAHRAAPVTYSGGMRFRRSSAGLLFALAAMLIGSPLPIAQADDCPTRVAVGDDGRGGVVWARSIHFPGRPPQQVVSTKRMGAGRLRGRLLECVRGGLGMVLDVAERDGGLVFTSRRYFLALGPLALPLPHLVTPGRCTVTHTDAGPGRFRFTLAMRHPLWGETFHQDGLFDDPEAP
jgi:hypothetical protein